MAIADEEFSFMDAEANASLSHSWTHYTLFWSINWIFESYCEEAIDDS